MAESKKFWYIKLNVHFFEDDRIDWLCDQENGYAYVVLYLKLCLKTANNNGILSRQIGDMIIPYNVEKIAETTHIDIELVKVALELYKRIGLIYEADKSCQYMRLPEVPGMVGYITQAALDKRKQRNKKAETADNVPDIVPDIVQQELRVKSKELRVYSKIKRVRRSASASPRPRWTRWPSIAMSGTTPSARQLLLITTRPGAGSMAPESPWQTGRPLSAPGSAGTKPAGRTANEPEALPKLITPFSKKRGFYDNKTTFCST